MDMKKVGGLPQVDTIDRATTQVKPEGPQKAGQTFADFLGEKLVESPKPEIKPDTDLKFSAHAQSRLTSRGIELSPDELIRMKEAIQRASEKGSKESLILTDKAAFVVSVKNNTVITAVDRNSMKENVFTNIDSTIMI